MITNGAGLAPALNNATNVTNNNQRMHPMPILQD